MEQPKIKRILQLIVLLSGNRVYTIEELAERLETSERTIYRYLTTFKEAGFAVEKVADFKYRLISIGSGVSDISNVVYFSDEEAYIVNRLIDSLDPGNSLKAGLRQKLAAIYDSTDISQHIDNRNTAKIVEIIVQSIREKKVVEFRDYVSSLAGQTRDYRVEAFKFTSNFSDIWAFDLKSGINKRFKVMRIGEVIKTDDPWTKEYAHREEPMDAFHCHGPHEYHVVLKLNNAGRNIMVEEFPLTEPDAHPAEDIIIDGVRDQVWIYDGICHDLWGVGRFVLGQQLNIEVLECDELKNFLLASADNIIEMYGAE